ncbi:MAG: OmpH family outer membrane protein [Fibrobacteria bacterium]|nr:OmpH family outer membrane protein [Fibrobacteria bacterium]
MFRICFISILLLSMLSFSKPTEKFGFVKTTILLEDFIEVRRVEKNLAQEKTLYQKAIQVFKDSLQTKVDSLNKNFAKADEKTRKSMLSFVNNGNQKLDLMIRNADKKLVESRERLMAPVYEKINRFIEKYARKHGYKFIFGTTTGNILYADKDADVTNAIIDGLNELYREVSKK